MIDIKVKGFDEVIKELDRAQKGLTPEVFANWVNTIEKRAKELCNDPDCKRITFKPKGKLEINIKLADAKAIDCVIQAIRQYIPKMPFSNRGFYEQVIKQLEASKTKFSKPV